MNGNAIFAKQELFSYEKTAGDLLREARELKGLSQQDVASALNLMTSHVVALESDRYNPDLEGKHFAQYIKSYADLVELNPEILLALYETRNHSPLKTLARTPRATISHAASQDSYTSTPYSSPDYTQPYEPSSYGRDVASKRGGQKGSSGLASRIIAVMSLLFLAWFINRGELEPRDLLLTAAQSMQASGEKIQEYVQRRFPFPETQDGVNAETAQAKLPVDIFERESVLNLAEELPADTSLFESVPSQEGQVMDNAIAQEQSALAQALAAPDSLEFIFAADCWVEVYDESGAQVFMGNNLAGSQLNLSGNGPFEILVGNSRGVSLRFNGDVVPVKVHEYSDHTRFVVGAGGIRVTTKEVFSAAFENFKAEQLARDSSGVKVSISEENFQAYRLDVVDSGSSEAGPTIDELSFQFSADCWVEVYDKEQRPMVMETKLAGETLRVKGEAPFEVRVGNSRAVRLTLNGQAVSIKQHPDIDSTELVVGQR